MVIQAGKQQFEKTLSGKGSFVNLLMEMNKSGNKKLCWVGDSITEQGKTGFGNNIGYTTYIEQLYPKIKYFNEGTGGNTSLDVINRLSTITARAADCYVLAIGVNDCRYNDSRGATTQTAYVANMTTIINSLRASGAKVVVVSIWPTYYMDQFASLGRFNTDLRMTEWNAAIAKLCTDQGLIFVDTYTTLKKYVNLQNVDALFTDGVHPNSMDTAGKKLYAHALLDDDIPQGLYSSEYVLSANTGKFFYKLVVHDGDPNNVRGTGGYCCIKHINLLPYYKEFIAKTANTSYTNQYLFSYNSGYLGFYNKPNDFPMIIMMATDQIPTQLAITGLVSGVSNAHRGVRKFDLYHSKDRAAFVNPDHSSWDLVYTEPKVNAIAVNLLPKVRNNIFYKLSVTSFGNAQTTLKLKNICGTLPIRVFYQNALAASLHRYPLLFTTGVTVDTDSLQSTVLPFVLTWEAEEDLSSCILTSFNLSLGAWTLSKSRIEADISNPASTTWRQVATGTGDQTVTLDAGAY